MAEGCARRFRASAGWLVVTAVLAAAAPLRAQNLVTNGEFADGEADGWVLSPGGQVMGQVDGQAWIRLDGELHQDLATTPGENYVLSFRAQGLDPASTWSPNSLRVYWDDVVVAAYD